MLVSFRIQKMRSAGIVIRGDEILLMKRRKNGSGDYYVIPGGSVDAGEDPETAAVREIKEETTVEVTIDRLLYTHVYTDLDARSFFFLCMYVSGEPSLSKTSEEYWDMQIRDTYYEPCWVPLQSLGTLPVFPVEIRDALIRDVTRGFPSEPQTTELKSTELITLEV